MPPFIYGDLSVSMQVFIRAAYGTLLFGTLLSSLGPSRWFFISERYGGYARSDPITDRIQSPAVLPCLLVLWFSCAGMMMLGYYPIASAFINLLLCRYFFIHMRWKGLLRGMGAPGFMTYWLGACVFFLEYGRYMDPTGAVRALSISAFRIDFAAIMLSAGFYKLFCGYPKNEGMEYGMVNPWWGYWWRSYQKVRPTHIVFRILNHLAYGTEIVAAVLMLIPVTQSFGAWLIILSFLFIATQIRLGFLCETVMVSALIFMDPGTIADQWIASSVFAMPASLKAVSLDLSFVNKAIEVCLIGYVIMLPLAHAGLWYNFLACKALPRSLQRVLERYTNFFGIIIWRVFSVDVVNFFADVSIMDIETGSRNLYSRFGALDDNSRFRYCHVGEFICLASLFTALKYYPNDQAVFQERLLRYSKTVPGGPNSLIVFEYRSIRKSNTGFEFVPVVEYVVDVRRRTIEERVLEKNFSARQISRASPVHEGAYPGTYAPVNLPKNPS